MPMLALSARIPATSRWPPVILVHGVANSAAVWTFWQVELAERGWAAYALDLRGHGQSTPADLARATMADYAADVQAVARQLCQAPVLIGWSMGGLVAMLAAAGSSATACVALAPSPPARQVDVRGPVRTGIFGPEEYGLSGREPEDQRAMPDLDAAERQIALSSLGHESRLARDERQQGIVLERLPCPLFLVTGTLDRDWPAERYADFLLPADGLTIPNASHWGLVLNRRALASAVPTILDGLLHQLEHRAGKCHHLQRVAELRDGLADPQDSKLARG